jgi:NAD(P)-dependent dehydrogenase (short-subunit alcohol dehydrogenase family)
MPLSIPELFDLSGKTAIVTGGGQGMGQAIAYRLAEAGANVAVVSRKLAQSQETVSEIEARGGKALAIEADVSVLDQINHAVTATIEHFGGVDILVNNAGGMHPFTPVPDMTEVMFDETIDRNLKSCFFMSQRAMTAMVAAGRGGNIINISSVEAARPFPQLTVYSATKAGVSSLTQAMACEFAEHHIQVNAIAPGPVRTTNLAAVYDDPDVAVAVNARVPMRRIADPDEIATAVLFLASAAASFVTGTTIFVDGGFVAQ